MVTEITSGVKIEVETYYQQDYSNPLLNEFLHAYRVTITNWNKFPIKLISRKWDIFDSNSEYRVVEGEGVVGVTPTIAPNEHYQYMSGCNLKSEMGRMDGQYKMQNLNTGEEFNVKIPVFEIYAPLKLN